MTLVTIGIPFYNNQQTILGAIRSVFAQTYPAWELILVDDGGCDRSFELVSQIKDSRVQLIKDGENRGLAYRLNQITNLAKGEYLARLDADDLNHPQRLEHQLNYLQQHPAVDVVATAVCAINQDNTPLGVRSFEPLTQLNPKMVLLNKGAIIHPTITAKTSWFQSYPYDPSYRRTQDRELWCRASPTSQFAKIPEPLYFYRDNPSTPQAYLKTYQKAAQMNQKLLDSYGGEYLGAMGTLQQKAVTQLKVLYYQIFTLLGQQQRLLTQRNQPLNHEEQTNATTIINQILATPIPGID